MTVPSDKQHRHDSCAVFSTYLILSMINLLPAGNCLAYISFFLLYWQVAKVHRFYSFVNRITIFWRISRLGEEIKMLCCAVFNRNPFAATNIYDNNLNHVVIKNHPLHSERLILPCP